MPRAARSVTRWRPSARGRRSRRTRDGYRFEQPSLNHCLGAGGSRGILWPNYILAAPVKERVNMSKYLEVLTPQNSQIIFIDQQPQMAFGVQSIDRQVLKNNVVGLAKAAKAFNIPTTITTVESESFSGFTYPELLDVFPDQPTLERTSMNSWDDQKVRDALKKNGRNKVVVSGLLTEVCNTTFALCAMLEGGYEIYMVADASGGTSVDAHDFAMQRMRSEERRVG